MLDVLERGGITDAVIVVTRYFGGTLLGTGGLVRAYSGAARMALDEAGTVVMEQAGRYEFTCSYSEYDRAMRILRDSGVMIGEQQFLDEVVIGYTANPEKESSLEPSFQELTRGRSAPVLVESGFFPVREL